MGCIGDVCFRMAFSFSHGNACTNAAAGLCSNIHPSPAFHTTTQQLHELMRLSSIDVDSCC